MKLIVKNLGAIREANLDIAPLTVFVGHNNTNKTWTAYTYYGLAQSLAMSSPARLARRSNYYDLMIHDQVLRYNIATETDKAVAILAKAKEGEGSAIDVARSQILRGVQFPLTTTVDASGIGTILAIEPSLLGDAAASLSVSEEELDSDTDHVTLRVQRAADATELEAEQVRKDGTSWKSGGYRMLPAGAEKLLRDFVEIELRRLAQMRATVLALPAERKLLATLHTMIDLYRSRSNPEQLDKMMNRPAMDFLRFLATASYYPQERPRKGPFGDIVSLLEDQILQGAVGFQGEPVSRSLELTLRNGTSFHVRAASSIVKSLAGLDLYLSRFASNGDILMIDEPEMNAHPDVQLMITELLAILVNKGLRVILTTHSPYIVDQLNNLMKANKLPEHKKSLISSKLMLKQSDAFIDRRKVAVYWFGPDGQVKAADDGDTGLFDLSTFGESTDKVTNLYADILEAFREE